MASRIIKIDPVTRISGLLSIQVTIDNNRVMDARSGGMQFRGFEHMLQGRYPLDTIRLTSRTCGICSCAHSVASSMALEMALGVGPDFNGKLLRNLALGFEILQNNIRQTYHFLIPDYVELSAISPLYKMGTNVSNDYRIPKELNDTIVNHYMDAFAYARSAHKALAVLAGKAPHTHGVFVGGITTNYGIEQYTVVKALLKDISDFVNGAMEEDIQMIASYYPEYLELGKSNGNYLSYGVFADLPEELVLVNPGVLTRGEKKEVNIENIRESLAYTWLQSKEESLSALHEPPGLNYSKPGAYSWVEAPRYQGGAYEVGPLADLIVNKLYTKGTGALHRIIARVQMTKRIIAKMDEFIERARFQPAYQKAWQVPEKGEGYALVGAPRGGLLHWLTIENSKIKNYSLIPPTTWNMSPMDEFNVHGAVEQALIGTPIEDITRAETVIGRIVRSFDPCLNCAAHVITDKKEPFEFLIV
jgi:hydrogenase large subunit